MLRGDRGLRVLHLEEPKVLKVLRADREPKVLKDQVEAEVVEELQRQQKQVL